jgi:hypothetical protein
MNSCCARRVAAVAHRQAGKLVLLRHGDRAGLQHPTGADVHRGVTAARQRQLTGVEIAAVAHGQCAFAERFADDTALGRGGAAVDVQQSAVARADLDLLHRQTPVIRHAQSGQPGAGHIECRRRQLRARAQVQGARIVHPDPPRGLHQALLQLDAAGLHVPHRR